MTKGVSVDRFVRAWVEGWVVSRGAAPPVTEPWGWTVDVGTGHHVTRHVLGATNDAVTEPVVRRVAGAVTGAGVWLKVFADPALVGPWLGPGWWIDPEPGFLMTAPLTDAPPGAAPDGYRTRTWSRGGVVRTMIAAPDGSLAARGQIAPTGATAVVDQIETSPLTAAAGSARSSCAPCTAQRPKRARGPASSVRHRRAGHCTSPWAGASSHR